MDNTNKTPAQLIEEIKELQLENNEFHDKCKKADIMHDISMSLASSLSLEKVLEDLIDGVVKLISLDSLSIFIKSGNDFSLVAGRGFENLDDYVGQVFRADNLFAQEMEQARQPIIVEDAQKDPRLQNWGDVDHIRGWMLVPFIVRGRVIGHMSIDSRIPNAYQQEQADIAFRIAHHAAIAIDNAQLFEKAQSRAIILEQRNHEISTWQQLEKKLAASLDLDEIYKIIYEEIGQRFLGVPHFTLALYDEKTKMITCGFAIVDGEESDISLFPPKTFGEDPISDAIRSRRGHIVDLGAIAQDLEEKGRMVFVGDERRSMSAIYVPLLVQYRVLGVLIAQSYEENAFDEESLAFMTALANQSAIALENALLFTRVQENVQEQERHVAERTAKLEERVQEMQTLNQGMANLMDDLNSATAAAHDNAHRLEAANIELDAFSYSVSHDLRAPLRHVDGYVQLLVKQASGQLDEKSQHYLDIILKSAEKMGHLIDDLLMLSRMGRADLKLRPVDLNLLVEDTRVELQDANPKRNLAWTLADLPLIQADSGLMRIVWINLLGNAVKYTQPCDTARIEVGFLPVDEKNNLTFFVRDNGVGFDPNYTNKLFGVFQRLHQDDEFEGTGIGLATVRRIIHRHGGKVWAEAELEQGATFYFSLPKGKEIG